MGYKSIRVVGDTGCEKIHKEKKVQRTKFLILLSQGREMARCRDMHQHQHRGARAVSGYQVWKQPLDVSVRLQLVLMLSLGAGSGGCCGLVCSLS